MNESFVLVKFYWKGNIRGSCEGFAVYSKTEWERQKETFLTAFSEYYSISKEEAGQHVDLVIYCEDADISFDDSYEAIPCSQDEFDVIKKLFKSRHIFGKELFIYGSSFLSPDYFVERLKVEN